MFRGFRWLALGAVVVTAALVGPSVALACDGGGSATSIYTECVPKAGGGSSKHSHKKTPTRSTQPTTKPTVYPTTPPPPPPVHVSKKTTRALHRSGKDKPVLNYLLKNPGLVDPRELKTVLTASRAGETNLGSAFDLGAGPTLLLALLLGTVLVLLGTGGVRSWRNRHRA